MPTLETASKNVDVIKAPLSGSVSADEVSKAVAVAGLPGSEEKDEEDEELGGFGSLVDSSIIK